MDPISTFALLAAAAFGAGVLNAIAGGGTFLTFPALVWTGVPPIAANATSALAVCPGYLGSALGFRQELAALPRALLIREVVLSALGGVAGYFLVGQLQDWLPYFLAVASSSFVYVALADLIPQLQKRLTARETIAQIAWLIAGMVVVMMVSGLAHNH